MHLKLMSRQGCDAMSEETKTNVVIGTAGHIDHGKSSLVLALSGKDPDRLAEEKERGITITLGFAELKLPDDIHAGVVDVPGHERFVREMIAGATGIDVALLCIAADDGIMPQTREHLNVLRLLGVPTCVVALTKCDTVDDDWAEVVRGDVENFLLKTPYVGCDIVKVSSKTGQGLDELKNSLAKACKNTTRHILGETARQPIDRVFTIKGAGTVITGTLWSGSVRIDDTLEILPTRKKTRVRSIQIHDVPKKVAEAGNRVALNLVGVSTDDVRPGFMLATPNTIKPSDSFDVEFTYVASADDAKPLKSGSNVHVAHGTKETVGRLLLFNGKKEVLPGEKVFAQIRTNEKLPVSYLDRYVVRSYSPVEVIGGGTILRAHPRRKTNIKDSEMKLIEALSKRDQDEIVASAFEMQMQPITPKSLSLFCGIPEDDCKVSLIKLKAVDKSVCVDPKCCIFATKEIFNNCINTIESTLKRFHAKEPNATGISKEHLKELSFNHIDSDVFDALLGRLVERGAVFVNGGEISHSSAGSGAKAVLDEAEQKILALLKNADQNPPFIKDISGLCKLDTKICSKALTSLESKGDIVRIGKDFYFEKQVIDNLKNRVKDALQTSEGTVANLKDAMNTSRKFAVPILEHFDKLGFTKREGDVRVLK